jgi:hypothetical protein
MMAAMVAALALAGAPPSTPVTCNPDLPSSGVTHLSAAPVSVEVIGRLCGGLLYASASRRERAALRRLNPHVAFAPLAGLGMLVMLHESEHVALHSSDECVVERAAMAKLPQLLGSSGFTTSDEAQALAAATSSDAGLPAAYHGC